MKSSYWFCRKNSNNKKEERDHSKFNFNIENLNHSVHEEKQKVIFNAENNIPIKGLRIFGIEKTYHTNYFGIKSPSDVYAVKNIFLDTQHGELLSILGHNGAGSHNIIISNSICNEGKSTLIGVLTGCFEPTGGTAEVDGLDIRLDSDEVTSYF